MIVEKMEGGILVRRYKGKKVDVEPEKQNPRRAEPQRQLIRRPSGKRNKKSEKRVEMKKIEMIKKESIEGSDQAKTKNGKRIENDDEDDGKE